MTQKISRFFRLFTLGCCILSGHLKAQTDSTHIALPEDWIGHWVGEMQIHNHQGKVQTIGAAIIISKTSSPAEWSWKIIYDDGKKRQERAYALQGINTLQGKYRIDERNSILLSAFYADHTLMSVFTVADNQIMTTYRRHGNTLYFENMTIRASKPLTTGGNGDIPQVLDYPVRSLQRAVLTKQR